ncbi:MAG: hypothetical protein O0X49_07700, partial [Methanocorpusculum sp.]|nr:hypothetical protein [Methanocorpusculum sp.]
MKNTKIMAVLAVLLVAALFIGAASAAERAVATGETAYIGENITITGAAGPWIALAGSGSTSPVATNVTGGSYISLTSISVATYDVLKSDDGSAWNKDSTLTVTVADLPTVSITPAEIYVNTELSATLNAVLPNGVSEVSVSYNGVETTLTTTTATVIGKAVAGQTDITLTKVNGIASFATAPDVATITVSSTSDADIDNFTAAPDATEIATGSSVTIDINATKQLTTPVWLSWGDGTTEQLDFASSVNVSMSHTYALADTYPVIVMNGPTPGQSTRLKTVSTITVTGTAGEIVVDMPITAAQGSTVEITFTSMGVVQPANVTVKFGDGQTKTASFSSIQGGFEAVVENIYATVGTYTVSYTINGVETEAGEITITPAEYRYIQGTGQDVFVYEHIDVNTVVSGASKLTKYSDGAIPSAVNVIAGTAGKFYLTEEVVNGQYGKYVIDGNYDASGFVYVWYPELSLQAELTTGANGATSGDSIDGKNVNKDTVVSFLINAPKVGPAFYNNAAQTGATAKIVFTTPASGKTTTFGTGTYALPFGTVTLTSAQTMAGYTQAGEDATAGTWTAQAEYTSPQAFSDY